MNEMRHTPSKNEPLYNKKLLIIFLFFFIVCTVIASVWSSGSIEQIWHGHIGPGTLMAVMVSLILLPLAMISGVAVMAVLWGKKEIYHGFAASQMGGRTGITPSEVSIIRLFGVELFREYAGRWQEVAPEPAPEQLAGLPWSHIAFDAENVPAAEATANDILVAAVWRLIAAGAVQLSVRREALRLLSLWNGRSRLSAYCTFRHPVKDIEGYWEQCLLRHIQEKTGPIRIMDWLIDAFGETVSNVPRRIRTFVWEEYAAKGLGSVSGMLMPKFIYTNAWQPATNAPHWHTISSYIREHDRGGVLVSASVYEAVAKAMKNRESSD